MADIEIELVVEKDFFLENKAILMLYDGNAVNILYFIFSLTIN